MSTLHLSDSLLDGYVALFRQLEPRDQTILLNKLAESTEKRSTIQAKRDVEEIVEDVKNSRLQTQSYNLEKEPDPSGIEAARQIFGAWGREEDREDIDQMVRAITENRMWKREVEL